MLDQGGPITTVLWVPSHKGIPGKRPTMQLKKRWTRTWRWKNGNNEIKERKPDVDRKEDTKGILNLSLNKFIDPY
jgi:hypothetical protein